MGYDSQYILPGASGAQSVVALAPHNAPGAFHHCGRCEFSLAVTWKIPQQPADFLGLWVFLNNFEFPLAIILAADVKYS